MRGLSCQRKNRFNATKLFYPHVTKGRGDKYLGVPGSWSTDISLRLGRPAVVEGVAVRRGGQDCSPESFSAADGRGRGRTRRPEA